MIRAIRAARYCRVDIWLNGRMRGIALGKCLGAQVWLIAHGDSDRDVRDICNR
jgi:hypothetical protein